MTDEQKTELRAMVETVFEEQRQKRMHLRETAIAEDAAAREERLYLMSFPGHIVGIPDDSRGAIMTNCCYARVKVSKDNPQFYSGEVTVVALGDGRLLKTPIPIVLNGQTVSMAEVAADFLDKMKLAAGA